MIYYDSVYKYNLKGNADVFFAFPGVYILSGVTTNNFHSTFPIYKSINNFLSLHQSVDERVSDAADAMMLLPGFKCIVYQNINYGGDVLGNFNNTTSNIKVFDIGTNNAASSIKVYFGENELIFN